MAGLKFTEIVLSELGTIEAPKRRSFDSLRFAPVPQDDNIDETNLRDCTIVSGELGTIGAPKRRRFDSLRFAPVSPDDSIDEANCRDRTLLHSQKCDRPAHIAVAHVEQSLKRKQAVGVWRDCDEARAMARRAGGMRGQLSRDGA
jgi:hypothetical protein